MVAERRRQTNSAELVFFPIDENHAEAFGVLLAVVAFSDGTRLTVVPRKRPS